MPPLAFLTALPIALAFIVSIGAFMAMTALMIRTQRHAEGRESPLTNEFWRYRDNVNSDDEHEHPGCQRNAAQGTRPKIHSVTYRRRHAGAYNLPDEYELAGATR